MLKNNL